MLQQWLADPSTEYLRQPVEQQQPKERQYSPNRKQTQYSTDHTYLVVKEIEGIETVIGVVEKLGKRQFRNPNTGRIYRSLREASESVSLRQTVKAIMVSANGLVEKR